MREMLPFVSEGMGRFTGDGFSDCELHLLISTYVMAVGVDRKSLGSQV